MGKKFQKAPATRFFTFPVELLRLAFNDMTGLCSKAIGYAVFIKCKDSDLSPKEAFDFFRISGNHDVTVKRGKELYESLQNPPLTSVNVDIIMDFYHNPKSDFEIAVLCAFCGLRSIIGTKDYVKTNNGLLMARMFGYRSTAEFEVLSEKPRYYQDFFRNKRTISYQLNKKIIEQELCLFWGLEYYSYQMRGFYVSFTMDLDSLATLAEKSRKSNLLKQQREKQKQVIDRVRKQIRGK